MKYYMNNFFYLHRGCAEMGVTVAPVPVIIFLVTFCVRGLYTYESNPNGVLYPSDPFKFIGEMLELYCNITNTHLQENSTSLYIEKESLIETNLLPVKYIEILTSKSIRFRLENVQISDNGRYNCRLKTHQESLLIGYQIVKVDYRPGKVFNFTCKVFNWKSMKCTWNLGVHYVHQSHINITLVYAFDGAPKYCPHLNLTSCKWPKESYTYGHLYYIKINVSTVNNNIVLDYKESEEFIIDTKVLVKPSPVGGFKAQVINSSCVKLTWHHSAKSREKFYKAYYTSNNKMREILLVEDEVMNYYAWVCHLTAFTSYKFQIAVLPNLHENQGFSSKWSFVNATTSEDVPASAPEICSGCYYDVTCTQYKSSNNRCIQLIWKDLNVSEKRGEITEYKVTTETKSKSKVLNSFHIFVNDHKHLITTEIYIQEAEKDPTKISLIPGTKKGFSEESSYLIVPLKTESPKPPNNFLVEREKLNNGSNHFYMSWAPLHSSSEKIFIIYKSVTIVWCHRARENKCHENVSWSVLDASNVTYELTLADEDLLIGISAQAEDGGYTISSGISWADCIYLRKEVPQLPPPNVKISSAHSLLKNSLHIMWEHFQCSKDAIYVLEYLIKYCPISEDLACSDVEKTENVSHHKNEVILRNLKGNTKYKLQIIAVSAAGLGPPSETFISDVMEAAPESDTALVTVVSVVAFAITISIILFLSYRCYIRGKFISEKVGLQSNHISEPLCSAQKNTSLEEISPENQNVNSSVARRTENENYHSPLIQHMTSTEKNHEIKDENEEDDLLHSNATSSASKSDYIKFGLHYVDQQLNEPLIHTLSDSGYNSENGFPSRNHEFQVWYVSSGVRPLLPYQYTHCHSDENQPMVTFSGKSSTLSQLPLLPDSSDVDMIGSPVVNINKSLKFSFSRPSSSIGSSINEGKLQIKNSVNNHQLHSSDTNPPSTCPSYCPNDNASNNAIVSFKRSVRCDVSCSPEHYIKPTSCMLFQNQPKGQHYVIDVNRFSALMRAELDTYNLPVSFNLPVPYNLPVSYLVNSSEDSQQHSLVIGKSDLKSDISCEPSHSSKLIPSDYNANLFKICLDNS
ncbi:hypothetical protein Btru_076948 [Bulinus truncatus]|nr:hypothetical protein Btru_076948 [Bulinus truncatus]